MVTGDWDLAERCFTSVLGLAPDAVEVMTNLAIVHQQTGRHDEAAAWLRRVGRADPSARRTTSRLADVMHDALEVRLATGAHARAGGAPPRAGGRRGSGPPAVRVSDAAAPARAPAADLPGQGLPGERAAGRAAHRGGRRGGPGGGRSGATRAPSFRARLGGPRAAHRRVVRRSALPAPAARRLDARRCRGQPRRGPGRRGPGGPHPGLPPAARPGRAGRADARRPRTRHGGPGVELSAPTATGRRTCGGRRSTTRRRCRRTPHCAWSDGSRLSRPTSPTC